MLRAEHMHRWLGALALTLSLSLVIGACGRDGAGSGEPGTEGEDGPKVGQTSFLSAGNVEGSNQRTFGAGGEAAAAPASDLGGKGTTEERTVEEGDIYRVLGDGLILNLNPYRGLQVIDVSNPAAPAVTGRLKVAGHPVEMYVVEDVAVVLLNDWQTYKKGAEGLLFESERGGLVLTVDLADPAKPAVIDRVMLGGSIQTSRLTRGGGGTALYLAAQEHRSYGLGGVAPPSGGVATSPAIGAPGGVGAPHEGPKTIVSSYSIAADGKTTPVTTLDLGGYVADIQATTEVLLVARNDWSDEGGSFSRVSLVDISDPAGQMVEGADVKVKGQVRSKFNMDFYKGILRVVSSSSWSGSDTNHIETFDAADLQDLAAVDHKTFAKGEQLYATLFLGNKAFFVTYLRVDPFHAFEITDDGTVTERSEFIVSGWNDFFKPAFDTDVLVGVGVNDEEKSLLAVSLYDSSDLDNPEPMVDRKEIGSDWAWSEARWDDRAFTVLEGAVEVDGPADETETGLVLLPFAGWDAEKDKYVAAVQILTFSKTSLTLRGVMEHGSQVRRSFLAGASLPANLSDEELSLFDCADPDAPVEKGRVELAPRYTQAFVVGDHVVRLRDMSASYGWWWGGHDVERTPNRLEVVPAAEDPDAAAPVAAEEVSAGATVVQAGDLLVSVLTTYGDKASNPDGPAYDTKIEVLDFSSPASPTRAGTLETDKLAPSYGGYRGGPEPARPAMDCMDCGGGWYGTVEHEAYAVPGAVAFVQRNQEEEKLGEEEVCSQYPTRGGVNVSGGSVPPSRGGGSAPSRGTSSASASGGTDDEEKADEGDNGDDEEEREPVGPSDPETWYSGAITCRSLDGGPKACEGEIRKCTSSPNGTDCVKVDPEEVELHEECWSHDLTRYWQRFVVQVLDLSDPAAPRLLEPIDLPQEEAAGPVLAVGSDLYLSHYEAAGTNEEGRTLVAHYFRRLALADLSDVEPGDKVNVPGTLVAVDGDTIYTWDRRWSSSAAVPSVYRLALTSDGKASLEASRSFDEDSISTVMLDGAGHLLVTHQRRHDYEGSLGGLGGVTRESTATATSSLGGLGSLSQTQKLAVLDATSPDLAVRSDLGWASWATLRHAVSGRALLSVDGGFLVANIDDPAAPYAQAFFPAQGWPRRVGVSGSKVIFAADQYGVHSFDLDGANLD